MEDYDLFSELPSSVKNHRRELGENLKTLAARVCEIDAAYLENIKKCYWQNVDHIIRERRKPDINRVVEHEIALVQPFVTDEKQLTAFTRRAKRRGELKLHNKKKFRRLLRKTLKQWQMKRDRDIHEEIQPLAKLNQRVIDDMAKLEGLKENEIIEERRKRLIDEMYWTEQILVDDAMYAPVKWLATDLNAIDFKSSI